VRQAPITVQNVVTYDVVINVDNPEMLLLPGMTADARIITDERENALRVTLAALRFEPGETGLGGSQPTNGAGASSHVWVLRGGAPVRLSVDTGIDDGVFIEILPGGLKVGDAVIIDEVGSAAQKAGAAPARSPLRL
jgi:HlyD family secretion protein